MRSSSKTKAEFGAFFLLVGTELWWWLYANARTRLEMRTFLNRSFWLGYFIISYRTVYSVQCIFVAGEKDPIFLEHVVIHAPATSENTLRARHSFESRRVLFRSPFEVGWGAWPRSSIISQHGFLSSQTQGGARIYAVRTLMCNFCWELDDASVSPHTSLGIEERLSAEKEWTWTYQVSW